MVARKIEPSLLRWCGFALAGEAGEYRQRHARAPVSIADGANTSLNRPRHIVAAGLTRIG
jgi:hypothetical protein